MEWDLLTNIVEQIISEPLVSRVIFELHNEPLLDKRIFDCVKYLKTKCPDKYCMIITNGQLLHEFNPTEIIQSNLDHMVVSVNAHTKAMYEQLGSCLSYDEIMNNVTALLSNELLRKRIILSFLLTKQNQHDLRRAIKYWNT
jgi:MoaA/NifB/PqqE/SkfB family radical SAM enzyme